MGLPSGLKWAKNDIDVSQNSNFALTPFQYEKTFFSWGNVVGHNPISDNEFDYDWGNINAEAPYYDGQPYGETLGASIGADLTTSQDAARVTLGSPWRMPTTAEFKELFDNCDFVQADGTTVIDAGTADKRVTVNGVLGIYLKSRLNGNLLFFACSGFGYDTTWSLRDSLGYYWSSSFHSVRDAFDLVFSGGGFIPQGLDNRFLGFPVRPVFGAGLRSNNRGLNMTVGDERLEREVEYNRFDTKYLRNVQE